MLLMVVEVEDDVVLMTLLWWRAWRKV